MNPLDQLADINIPDQISIWPLAWGYWLVIALSVLAIVALVRSVVSYRKLHRPKKRALAHIQTLEPSDPQFVHKVQIRLKHLCQHYFVSDNVALMHGSQWRQFLKARYKGKQQSVLDAALNGINAQLYSDHNTVDSLKLNSDIKNAVIDWIEQSLPVKPSSKSTSTSASVKSRPNNKEQVHV